MKMTLFFMFLLATQTSFASVLECDFFFVKAGRTEVKIVKKARDLERVQSPDTVNGSPEYSYFTSLEFEFSDLDYKAKVGALISDGGKGSKIMVGEVMDLKNNSVSRSEGKDTIFNGSYRKDESAWETEGAGYRCSIKE